MSITIASFLVLMASEIVLFRKATQLSVGAKKRYEKDNEMIYERINNLEYIKTISGEDYEREKITQQLKSTFHRNKKSLFYRLLFQAFPIYVIIPNIPRAVVGLILLVPGAEEIITI